MYMYSKFSLFRSFGIFYYIVSLLYKNLQCQFTTALVVMSNTEL